MIGAVTVEGYAFRMTTRAMMQIERDTGEGIVESAAKLETGFSVTTLVAMLAACMNNGDGASKDDAASFIDQHGFQVAADALGKIFEAAFGEASKSEKKSVSRSK